MNDTATIVQQEAASDAAARTAQGRPVDLRLAYLTTEYPKASHTFIRREILELERQGIAVERLSIRDSGGAVADAVDQDEAARTTVLLHKSAPSFIGAVARMFLTRPMRWSRALRTTLQMGRLSDRGVLRHLAYLVEACLLVRIAQQRRIDHVHVHFGTNAAAVARLMRILGGPTYSMTVHGPDEFDAPRGFSLGEKVSDAAFVCAISEYCAAQLRRWTPYEHWHKINIVHCTVDESFLAEPTTVRADSTMILSIGRLSAQKGQLLLIEAFAQLVDEGMDVQLVLAGDGEMRSEIESRIRNLDCEQHVTITGYVDEQRIRELLTECRALVQPSFAEGLPVVMMEALAMGRPVIATQITGVPELVTDGENGWLITAGSVTQIAEAMREALQSSNERLTSMGLAGRERVLSQHRCRTEVERLIELFGRVCGPDASERV